MIQTTESTKANTYINKSFYDRKLLETAKTRLVFGKFGQKRTIPLNSGKRVEFRRYDLFDPEMAVAPLTEGVTPDGQSLSQSRVEAEVSQYGAYVEISDLLEQSGYDEVVSDSAELLGEQIGTVVEWITRDAVCAGTNVQYAGGKTSRKLLTENDRLTVGEIRKAVRALKRAKARFFNSVEHGGARKPHYICICSPEATYDLQSDELWQDVSKYSNAEQIYSGEIGRLFGVVFVESTEAKIFRQSVYTKVKSHVANSDKVELEALSASGAACLNRGGMTLFIGENSYEVASADAATRTVTLKAPVVSAIPADTLAYTDDAGPLDDTTKEAMEIHSTLVFGADAYGIIDLGLGGALQTIVKTPGSAGAADPLNQRGTVAAKVAAYTATILNQLWIVRIEHSVSN